MKIKKLLFYYFLFTFSYVHLPFTIYFHGFGSLFNYIMPFIILYGLFNFQNILMGKYLLITIKLFLMFLLLGLLQFILLFNDGGDENNIFIQKIIYSILSSFLMVLQIVIIVSVAHFKNFRFENALKAVRISVIILIVYLSIEMLGMKYRESVFMQIINSIEPFIHYRL